jgi:hypothetical protein
MKKIISVTSAIALLMFVFFGLAAIFSEFSRAYHNSVSVVEVQNPPYVHNGNGQDSPVLKPGDTYFLHLEVMMKAECRVETQNKIERREEGMTGAIMYNYPFIKGMIKNGPRELDEIFEVPSKLPPGKYAHVRISMFYCNGFEWSMQYPDARFNIQ